MTDRVNENEAGSMNEEAKQVKGKIRQAASSLASDTKESASTLMDDFNEIGKIAKDATKDSLDAVQKHASNYYEKGQQKFHEVEKKMEGQMREYPMRTVLIALGAGFLLGMMKKSLTK